jgi:SAM-dependent methyltransferase
MSIRTRFFAATYDSFMKGSEQEGLTDMRRMLMDQATGRVLEIGGGTGLNLPHYGPQVNSLTITEPDPSMLKRLERRFKADRPATTVLRAPAEDLPFEDGTFDMVVSTLVLCGVDDQPRAVREIRRVLRPGGTHPPLPGTRPIRRPEGGPKARPHELAEPAGRMLRVQPTYPPHDRRSRIRSRVTPERVHAEGAQLRAPRDRRGSSGPSAPPSRRRRSDPFHRFGPLTRRGGRGTSPHGSSDRRV